MSFENLLNLCRFFDIELGLISSRERTHSIRTVWDPLFCGLSAFDASTNDPFLRHWLKLALNHYHYCQLKSWVDEVQNKRLIVEGAEWQVRLQLWWAVHSTGMKDGTRPTVFRVKYFKRNKLSGEVFFFSLFVNSDMWPYPAVFLILICY